VSRAVAVALGHVGGPAGPVHLNLPLREPLVPVDDGVGFPHPLDGRPDGAPWTASGREPTPVDEATLERIRAARHGVVVAGDALSPTASATLADFAARNRWPLIAEPHSNARRGPTALRAVDALLRSEDFTASHRPDLVVVAGRVGLTRPLLGWLASSPQLVVDRDGRWWDATRTALAVVRGDVETLADVDAVADPGWADAWTAAAEDAGRRIDAVLDEPPGLNEPRVARDVAAALPDGAALVVASSMPIRDVDLTMRPRDGLLVVANRGVSGIDGFVSTAMGVAFAHDGETWALAGDLSLLHDANGFLGGERPDLTLVVVNNDGGGIFSTLPQARGDAASFERLFGTPHGVDLEALCAAHHVAHETVATPDELRAAVERRPAGTRVLEVRTHRAANARLHERLREIRA
jgi:2-succinyl-5-enolpyruvyl-6-hydroxy-3-cyclohexene-1-carboxylate synthase